MTIPSRYRAALLALAILSPIHARAEAADTAAAIAAFDDAAELMQSGKVEPACAKYQESYTLDPQLGTLLHLGYCQEQLARLASAWSAFRDAADWAKKVDDKRYELAAERAKMLEPRLSRLQLMVPADLPPDATIERNGKVIPPSVFRAAFPLDLGRYEITVSAPGHQSWTSTVELTREGQVSQLSIPTLREVPKAAASELATEPRGAAEVSLVARKWPAIVAGGVAVAGGVVWGVFGVQSMQAKADARDATGLAQWELRQQAYDRGTVATVGMIVTGVGVAAAVTLWALLPGKKTPHERGGGSPRVLHARVGLDHVQLTGSF